MRRDLTGQRFGRLVVLEDAGRSHGSPLWKCKCDCGEIKSVTSGHLVNGDTRSCGCLCRENRGKTSKTHGETKRRLYKIWVDIKTRCYNERSRNYYKYGKRGVAMCNEWKNSYEAFRDWSVANGYTDNLTIDRIDFNGNYTPNNCRWVTQKVQQNNRRNNHLITYDGETLTISQWNERMGFSRGLISQRLNKLGWSTDKAITTPQRRI